MIDRLLAGEWDESDALIVQPGERVGESFDQQVIAAHPAAATA